MLQTLLSRRVEKPEVLVWLTEHVVISHVQGGSGDQSASPQRSLQGPRTSRCAQQRRCGTNKLPSTLESLSPRVSDGWIIVAMGRIAEGAATWRIATCSLHDQRRHAGHGTRRGRAQHAVSGERESRRGGSRLVTIVSPVSPLPTGETLRAGQREQTIRARVNRNRNCITARPSGRIVSYQYQQQHANVMPRAISLPPLSTNARVRRQGSMHKRPVYPPLRERDTVSVVVSDEVDIGHQNGQRPGQR